MSEQEISLMDFKSNSSYNVYTDYNSGSTAYDYDFELTQIEKPNKNIKKHKKVSRAIQDGRANIMHSIQLVAATGIFFFGCVITITATSSVSEMRFKISDLKEQLSTLQNENTVLLSEISDTINLDYIEKRAINELGMSEPQEYQIKTISVPEQSYTLQYNDSEAELPEVNAELLKEFFFKG
ncbi:cell division protein FtsL [Clostridiales bacterium]|nr:cell division protein FtsL [Clostridiales bacterium]